MAVHAHLDFVRQGDSDYFRVRAEFLSSSPEAQLLVLGDYTDNIHPLIAQRLAERHGRDTPNIEDRLAAAMVALVAMCSYREWAEEGFIRDLADVVVELISSIGHHQTDGSRPFAPPPPPA
jgi:hypothetical protein